MATKKKKLVWPEIARRLDTENICTFEYEINPECGCLMKWTVDLAGEVSDLTHPDDLSGRISNSTFIKTIYKIRK